MGISPALRTGPRRVSRKVLAAMTAVAVPGAAVAVWAAAAASSEPAAHGTSDPCAASEVARSIGSVAKQVGDYLDAHPDTNQAMTAALQQPAGQQSVTSLKSYFEANPKAAGDMASIAQPLTVLSTQCKLPISLPQALGLVQAAQGGALPALPVGQPVAAAPGVPAGQPVAPAGQPVAPTVSGPQQPKTADAR
jgi:heme-binding protein